MAGRRAREYTLDTDKMFARLGTAVDTKYDPDKLAPWIEANTTIENQRYSFKDHEYQLKVLSSKKPNVYTKKCSQLGITELKIRRVLATCYMLPHFNAMITFPTTSMANLQTKTRIDPVIEGSDTLKAALDPNKNSAELKGIGTSQIFIRGTFNPNAAISVPVDLLAIDELDFSDQSVVDLLDSRQTHSKYTWRMETSTPTLPGYGIDKRMEASNRWFNLCKCNHCNHQFIPSYTRDVFVPGYEDDILLLDRTRLYKTRWLEAYLRCPSCLKQPDLSPQFREWICENNDEQHDADGIQISPFDAPGFITVQKLMAGRTKYERATDFVNFRLGLCQEDGLSGIQETDLDMMFAGYNGNFIGKVIGIDMGTTCHYVVAAIDGGRRVEAIETGAIDYRKMDVMFPQLVARVMPLAMVMDALPYTNDVHRFQVRFQNLYGALYVNSKSLTPFKFNDDEEDKVKGLLDQRQINVNRDVALDVLMEEIRLGQITANPNWDPDTIKLFRAHLRDMKRVRTAPPTSQPDTDRFRWVKNKAGGEQDHKHHALLYAHVASKIRLAARPSIVLPTSLLVGSARVKIKTGSRPEVAPA